MTSAYPLPDTALARRLEGWAVSDFAAYVPACRADGVYPDAEALRVAGGVAVWFSEGNVMNGAFGLGMGDHPVEQEEVAALIAFFERHGMAPTCDVCPHTDASLLRWLAGYRFVATDFETVLYQPIPAALITPPAAGVTVRVARTDEDRDLWAVLEARGFTDDAPTADHVQLARDISRRSDALLFIGSVDGEPAGTGMLVISHGIAAFNGDSTLPAMRNRGVQSAILAERLVHAEAAGCELALIEAAPGGTSQRNQVRAGFRVAYTRVSLVRAAG
jgi:hypothetical protein